MATKIDTKKKIVVCTNELLKKKSLDHITIKEICKKANIARSTFYTHFEDIYSIYEWEWDYYLKDILSKIGSNYDSQEGNFRMYMFMKENNKLFLNTENDLNSRSFTYKAARLTKRIIYKKIKSKSKKYYDNLSVKQKEEIDYLVYLQACATHKWVQDGMKMKPRDLSVFLDNLVPVWLKKFVTVQTKRSV